jgi:hypothetical protein
MDRRAIVDVSGLSATVRKRTLRRAHEAPQIIHDKEGDGVLLEILLLVDSASGRVAQPQPQPFERPYALAFSAVRNLESCDRALGSREAKGVVAEFRSAEQRAIKGVLRSEINSQRLAVLDFSSRARLVPCYGGFRASYEDARRKLAQLVEWVNQHR